jgi:hypothetical protein
VVFPRVKPSQHTVNHLPQSSVRLRMSGAIHPTPPICLYDVNRDFTFHAPTGCAEPSTSYPVKLTQCKSACNCSVLRAAEIQLACLLCTVLKHRDKLRFLWITVCTVTSFDVPRRMASVNRFFFFFFTKADHVKSSPIHNKFATPVLQTLNYSKRKQESKTNLKWYFFLSK